MAITKRRFPGFVWDRRTSVAAISMLRLGPFPVDLLLHFSVVTVVRPKGAKVMENTHVEQCASKAVNVTVRSGRPREYLTEREIDRLIEAAKGNRWGHRDATAILLAYRHGLRASELVALRWDDIDFRTSKLHVRRAKGGTASVHPLRAKELRALRRLLRETQEVQRATYLFVSERMAPLSVAGYQRMVARAGKAAGFG